MKSSIVSVNFEPYPSRDSVGLALTMSTMPTDGSHISFRGGHKKLLARFKREKETTLQEPERLTPPKTKTMENTPFFSQEILYIFKRSGVSGERWFLTRSF